MIAVMLGGPNPLRTNWWNDHENEQSNVRIDSSLLNDRDVIGPARIRGYK